MAHPKGVSYMSPLSKQIIIKKRQNLLAITTKCSNNAESLLPVWGEIGVKRFCRRFKRKTGGKKSFIVSSRPQPATKIKAGFYFFL